MKRGKSDRRPAGTNLGEARTACAAGVVGMGLMGTSISACLLAAGHSLHCVESDPAKLRSARGRLSKLLKDAQAEGVITATPAALLQRFSISNKISDLKNAEIVVESTVEDLAVKRQVISDIEQVVSAKALIGSNTSAIPVTDLQSNAVILNASWDCTGRNRRTSPVSWRSSVAGKPRPPTPSVPCDWRGRGARSRRFSAKTFADLSQTGLCTRCFAKPFIWLILDSRRWQMLTGRCAMTWAIGSLSPARSGLWTSRASQRMRR